MSEPIKPPSGRRTGAVHIDADEVHVESAVELPEGHVVVEPPTAATPALARPSTDVRDAVIATETETSLRTQSQRKINLIWEMTQAIVTILVVGATLFIAGSLVLRGESDDNRAAAFLLLSNAFFMIVTAYYQRTNHTRTGGVGGNRVDTDR